MPVTRHTGPFVGIRVVELGRLIAVPYCGQLLADSGADVVKVEALTGDPARGNGMLPSGDSRQFLNKNRGKRSLAIDLAHPESGTAVRRLIEWADVILANFRPGAARRLGFDYETASQLNPSVVYASNTAFGLSGPHAGMAGVDIAVQAYSGLWQAASDGPLALRDPMIDYTAGLLMSFGVAAALYHRERTGRGQRLDTALLQASLLLQNNHLVGVESDEAWRADLSKWLQEAFAAGRTWAEVLEHRARVAGVGPLSPYYGFVRTADGYLALGGFGREARERIHSIVRGHGSSSSDEGAASIQAAFAARRTEDWLADFESAGIPAAPLRFPEQAAEDPQVQANGFMTTLAHPRLGSVEVLGPPLSMSDTPLAPQGAPPDLGAHSSSVLAELGVSEDEIRRLEAVGAIRTPER